MELLCVDGAPWKDLGTKYSGESSSRSITEKANIIHTVSAHPMGTDLTPQVAGYNSINKDSDNRLLGVVNNLFPEIIQPVNSFSVIEPLLQNRAVSVEACDEAYGGQQVFGVFKVNSSYKVDSADVQVYLVCINNHLKPDGKVTILYLISDEVNDIIYSYINPNSVYKLRMPLFDDMEANASIAKEILENCSTVVDWASSRVKHMKKQVITPDALDNIIDELFPFVGLSDYSSDSLYSKANQAVQDQRDTFMECLETTPLEDGGDFSVHRIYQALLKFTQHYFKSADRGYDLVYRMNRLPGFSATPDPEAQKVDKFLKLTKKVPEVK